MIFLHYPDSIHRGGVPAMMHRRRRGGHCFGGRRAAGQGGQGMRCGMYRSRYGPQHNMMMMIMMMVVMVIIKKGSNENENVDESTKSKKSDTEQHQATKKNDNQHQTNVENKCHPPTGQRILFQQIPLDVQESSTNYTIGLDVAGYTRDDIQIVYDNNLVNRCGSLTIIGRRMNRMGNLYVFHRRFPLKHDMDEHNIRATLSDGVLDVTIQKKKLETIRQCVIPIATNDPATAVNDNTDVVVDDDARTGKVQEDEEEVNENELEIVIDETDILVGFGIEKENGDNDEGAGSVKDSRTVLVEAVIDDDDDEKYEHTNSTSSMGGDIEEIPSSLQNNIQTVTTSDGDMIEKNDAEEDWEEVA